MHVIPTILLFFKYQKEKALKYPFLESYSEIGFYSEMREHNKAICEQEEKNIIGLK